MDSSDLVILRHLLIEKNISVTAKLMNVSQPAITMRLGKLRIMFKDELLVRDGNRMKLTPKAEDMVHPIIRITDEMLSLIPTEDFNPHTTPTHIKLEVTEIVSEFFTKDLINAYLQYNNQHKISITTLSPSILIPHPQHFNNVDAIIGLSTHINGFNDEIYNYETSVLIYDAHFDPLKKSITYDEYLTLPHITFPQSIADHILLDVLGRPDPRNICLQLGSLKVAIELLQDRYVMTASSDLARILNKKYLPLPFDLQKLPFKLSYPEHLKHDKKNLWIRKVCKAVINALFPKHLL